MRDQTDVFSETVPGDEDGYTPAPPTPSERASGIEPEYDGDPNYRGTNDRPMREGRLTDEEQSAIAQVETPALELPHGNAKKDVWLEFGRALGYDEATLEPYSYDDLRAALTTAFEERQGATAGA